MTERRVMMVCKMQAVAMDIRGCLDVDAKVVGEALLGHRWETIMCPRDVLEPSGSERLDAATREWVEHLSLKLRPGGRIIWT